MADVKKSIGLMFDRPSEPLFTPKGEENSVFILSSQNFLTPEYENIGLSLNSRYGENAAEKIPIKDIRSPPNLRDINLPRRTEFSLFIPKHRDMAAKLIDIFMNVPENQLQDLLSTVAFCRDKVNPQLYNYALSVALLHRKDTRDIPIPNFAETFPSKFLDSQVFQEAREVARVVPKELKRNPIIIPRDFTATDLEEEHRIAYFREDIGINLHHWHWHLVYPFNASDRSIVNKDRRGELFFYMHQQIIARYNAERLSNSLPRVKRFNNFREPIAEAYFPKLDSLTSARGWPPRQAGMSWQDLNRSVDNINIKISDIETWRTRIEEAISLGRAEMPDGSTVPLTIDMLGNLIEASILSVNRQRYGDFHNTGHLFTAYMHDPNHRYLELFSVMADEATTMRDPFFYRWHAMIDDIFQKHKASRAVPAYSRAELNNPGVQIMDVQITGSGGTPNTINTSWMQSDVNLSRGLDFSDRGPVLVRFTHLNHQAFTYNINVNNTGSATQATVRIFMAPKNSEAGLPWNLADQRTMFIELDRFVTPLRRGANTISRRSDQSSVTIPFEQTFRDLSSNPREMSTAQIANNFCGCGWPQHMLVPKGTAQGMPYQLFVMLSNIDLDRVSGPAGTSACDDASSYCGIRDSLYPDKRAMGFPFDRPSTSASNIQQFLTPNMFVQDVTVQFNDMTVQNPRNPK